MAGRSFDDFDPYATHYRQTHTENIKISGADSFYFAEMKVKLLQSFEDQLPLRMLDVGCGDGATEMFVNTHFPSWKIAAIDTSEKSIEVAKTKKTLNCTFLHYDGRTIPFETGSFEVVFLAGVLHHIDPSLHTNLIKEIHRVLKPDGRFYLFEHNPLNPLTRHLVKTCVFDKESKLLKSSYAGALLKPVFEIKKKKFIIFFPRKGILSKLIFLEKYLQWLPLGGQYFFVAAKKR